MDNLFDIAVVGLGALGAATLWQLSQSGKKIIGVDQFSPPHEMGSSHGESRITRLAVGEGLDFIPLVKRSHELWNEIDTLTGNKIYYKTGGLLLDSGENVWSKYGSEGFFERTVSFAQIAGIPHEVLDPESCRKKFPQFNLTDTGKAYFEPTAGYLKPELAIASQLKLAEANGAIIRTHTKVLGLAFLPGGGVEIITNQGKINAGRAVITAGPWVKDFLPPKERSLFKICRQVLHWVPVDPHKYDKESTPIFMWGFGKNAEDFIYGFPSLDGTSIKMASESFVPSSHADRVERTVNTEEQIDFIKSKVSDRFNFTKKTVLKSKVCTYTLYPNSNFLVDNLPDFHEVLVASACSGHGFKHSAGLGEAIAQKLLDQSLKINLELFRWS